MRTSFNEAKWGVSMSVSSIKFRENLQLDVGPLRKLYDHFGVRQAEELICRTFESLSGHVMRLENLHFDADLSSFERIICDLIADSRDIGLSYLADLGSNVLECRRAGDIAATAATLSRLKRVSEPFLTADAFVSSMLI